MGFNQHEYQGNEHSRESFGRPLDRETIQSDESLMAKGERKLETFKGKIPSSVKSKSNDAIAWAKANPYKAATFGILGLMSLRSSFGRKLGRMAITIGASAFLKKKLDQADINL